MRKTVIIIVLTIGMMGLSILGYRHYQFSKQNIVLIALPKSGSTYLLRLLQNNLGFKRVNIYSHFDATSQNLSTYWQYFFSHKKLIAKEHYRAPVNLNAPNLSCFMHPIDVHKMQQYTNKMILHIRDPRQVLTSLLYHIHEQEDNGFIPEEMALWLHVQDLNTQIEWAITNLYPGIIAWVRDWVDFKDHADRTQSMQIMLTSYDMICSDDKMLYKQILKFYDMPKPWHAFARPVKDAKVRFRNVDKNEWRSLLNAKQQADVTAMIPEDLKQRFNWQ